MNEFSPQSPEARRKRLARMEAAFGHEVVEKLKRGSFPLEVLKRVSIGVYNDGFIHAGNLAYLALLALFPFFILAAAIANFLGQTESGAMTVATVLSQLPPDVADTLRGPVREVLTARTGPLLWLGAAVGAWTAASFIETIRDILRRAYGVAYSAPFWEYRLGSIGMIFAAVLMLMFTFALSVLLSSLQHAIEAWVPFADDVVGTLSLSRRARRCALWHHLRAFLRADASALSRQGLPQMARSPADHGLVAGDRRASSGGDQHAGRI
jgi:membrane protein